LTRIYQTRSPLALFEPAQAGALHLRNRIVMAPLTRSRAGPGLVPGPLAAEYYGQRATAGLIIAEATQVSAQAQGYADTPGCYTDDQVAGWRKVTDAVHARGGVIVVQLWHCGRVSHTSFQAGGQAPVGPSAIRARIKTFIGNNGVADATKSQAVPRDDIPGIAAKNSSSFVDCSQPRALELVEIPGIVMDFHNAALRAIDAGFDGVEIHGAHGYLLDAFLRDGTNHRTDSYGGSIANRARLLVEVMQSCASAIGADRLGVRISPVSTAGDSFDSNPQPLFEHVVDALNPLGLAYIHVVEGDTGGARDSIAFDYAALRDRFDGVWMVNNGYDRAMAIDAVASGKVDLVSFGRTFLANPDLVARLQQNAALNPMMDAATVYGGGAHGYIDYPTLDQAGKPAMQLQPAAD
jgi:N-ethylmaleimide reductase